MKNANELLAYMVGQKTYYTVRGTMGDADMLMTIDDDQIENFSGCEVVTVDEVEHINERAYNDILNYCKSNFDNVSIDEFYVIVDDDQSGFLLAWD